MEFEIPINYLNIYTTPGQAEQINNIMSKYINVRNCVITDATACIGGNSVFFMRDFKSVNMIEKNEDIFNILVKNISIFPNKNVQNCYYNCSYNTVRFMLKQDAIFIDPPWGGAFYKNKRKIKLYMDNKNVLDIIDELYHFTSIVCLKVPNNFDTNWVSDNFWNNKIHNITKNKKCVYKLILFYK
mgnify:CR=1 FL=1